MTPWLDDGDIRLYHGDALETVRQMPDESVDCVVTSPPYWGLRDYGTPGQMGLEETPDLFVAGMVELFREIRRVLAPHGTCWVNLGDSYAGSWGNQGRKEERGTQRPVNGGMLTPVHDGRYPDKESNTGAVPQGLKPKDLVGIPWRVAFALQQDGWWLRSDIIWAKPNPMPESVTDRPTKAHEYVFLLTKSPRYWFDAEAVREPHNPDGRKITAHPGPGEFSHQERSNGDRWPNSGRNVRSVWQIATQPYPEAHFATYPEELARRCILAGCPIRVCRVCGKPSERIVERPPTPWSDTRTPGKHTAVSAEKPNGNKVQEWLNANPPTTVGWSDCGHNNWRPGTVLDPFIGSGTTAKAARDHQRHALGIDLNAEYLELAARRLQQLSLLT